ncbi:MAG: ProQ/FinO family protein, partial [Rubrivivax sp.]
MASLPASEDSATPPAPDVPEPPPPDVPVTEPPSPDDPVTEPPSPDVPLTEPPSPDDPLTEPPTAPDAAATPGPPEKPSGAAVAAAVGAALAERFPALFAGSPPKPLKLRIQTDIQQRAGGAFTRKALSIFLHRHTTSSAYLRALAGATQRFDLDGAPAGDVTDEHRGAATAEVERRGAIVQARRAAEREARQARQRRPAGPPRDR